MHVHRLSVALLPRCVQSSGSCHRRTWQQIAASDGSRVATCWADHPYSTAGGARPIAAAGAVWEKSSRDTNRGEVNAQVYAARILTARHDLCLRAAASAVVAKMSWAQSLLATLDCSMVTQVVMRMVTTWACIDQQTSTSRASWSA